MRPFSRLPEASRKRSAFACALAAACLCGTAGQAAAGGGWTNEPVPALDDGNDVDLMDVGVGSDGQAWAFGYGYSFESPGNSWGAAYRRGPRGWTKMPDPPHGVQSAEVFSSDDIWTFGQDLSAPGRPAHWDGTKWTAVDGVGGWDLDSTSFAPNDIRTTALNADRSADTRNPLAWHWDGRTWTEVSPPSTVGWQYAGLDGASNTDVWLVGGAYEHSDASRGFAVHWDGNQWREVPVPDVDPGRDEQLTDVVATAPDDVWAAGYLGGDEQQPLMLHWDGDSWTPVDLPATRGMIPHLSRVGDEVWAFGSWSADDKPAALRYDGQTWQPAPKPDLPGTSVTAAVGQEDGSALAVGHWSRDGMDFIPLASTFRG